MEKNLQEIVLLKFNLPNSSWDAGQITNHLLFAFILIAVASGCSVYSDRYSVSVDNVMAMTALKFYKANVGTFTAKLPGRTSIMCKGLMPLKLADGKTFENFIRKALMAELQIAGVYSSKSPVTLAGYLDTVDFSSPPLPFTDGAWHLALTVKSSNGNSLSVKEEHSFGIYVSENVCLDVAQSFVPAVQDLIGNLVRNAEFAKLVHPMKALGNSM